MSYGIDSLVAVELRNWMVSQLDTNVPLLELIYSGSILKLARTIATNSTLVNPSILNGEDDVLGEQSVDGGGDAAYIISHIVKNVSAITTGRSAIATNGVAEDAMKVENDMIATASLELLNQTTELNGTGNAST